MRGLRKRGAVLAGGHLTILIFSRNSSDVRRYRIPKWILWSLIVALPPLIVLAVILSLNFFHNPDKASLIAEFQATNRIQQQEIRFFSERIAQLQNRIARMNEFDSKLRVIANLEHTPSSLFGVGGPLPDDLRERLRSQQGPDALSTSIESVSVSSLPTTWSDDKGLQEMEGLVQSTKGQLPHLPSVWPTRGWITGTFGCRLSPQTGQFEMHEGIEISNSVGTPIVAAADGLITTVGTDADHGRMVVLCHGHGIVTRYGQLGEVEVEIGQKVRRGQVIGKMEATGYSTGPYLYYEVRVNGIPTDPRRYLHN